MSKIIIGIVIVAIVVFVVFRTQSNKKLALENMQSGTDFLAANETRDGVLKTHSGLQYLVLSEGVGEDKPSSNSRVKVHYHGTLIDGTVFDSSVQRGQPIEFGLNQVIPGWTEGLQLMKKGEKTRLFIPPALGYGNRSTGSIPAGSVLIFDVELIDFH
jgi:peptidylprolyl isomerase